MPALRLPAARLALPVALLLTALAGPAATAAAQTGIIITSAPPPTYEFGQTISFDIAAESTDNISGLVLIIQEPDGTQVQRQYDSLVHGKQVTTTVKFDLAQSPLPPFAEITYWWEVTDAAGQQATSTPGTFYYEDNRFTWQRVGSGAVKVHWYSGTTDFGQAALDVAAGAMARINQDIRAPLPPHLDIYLYAELADAQAAFQRVGRSWINGHADPELGVIVVVVPDDLRADVTLQREIPHEMTHVLLYKATGAHFADLPVWLNEGLAIMNQGERDSQFPALLAAARDARTFLPLASLCGSFPTESNAALLAYAQSESTVRYLRERYGSEGIYKLISLYGRGAECDAGLQTSLGLTQAELETNWLRESVYAAEAPSGPALAPWLVLTGLVLLTPLLFLLLTARARTAKVRVL